MKFKILFIVTTLLISCGKLGDKAKDAVDGLSVASTDEAGSIIAYNNAMIDYMNEAGNKIDAAANDYEKMRTIVTQKRKPRMLMSMAFIGIIPDVNKDNNGIFLLKPGNNLPSDIREALVGKVKSASASFDAVEKAYKDFKNYYDLEDFKDDDWAKGKDYVDIIEKNITSFYDQRSEAYKIIKPLADAAEVELLKDHPLKEVLIASKADLSLVEEIIDIVYSENIDINALNSKYTELENNVKEHRVLTPELLKEHDKERSYKSYYEQLDDFLGELRKNKRDGKITQDEAEDISDEYKYLIRDYNSFV